MKCFEKWFWKCFEMWSSFMRSFGKNRKSKTWKIHPKRRFEKVFRTSFSARLKYNQMKVFFWKFLHYHKIDVFIDKCSKNHLKIRSFDWLKKCESFVKKHEKMEKFEKSWSWEGLNSWPLGGYVAENLKGKLATTRTNARWC